MLKNDACLLCLNYLVFILKLDPLPEFDISLADTDPLSYSTYIFKPRLAYFDIYTQPGSVYPPMKISITMSESVPLSGHICRVEVIYVGIYSVCAQPQYINSMNTGVMTSVQQ